MYSTFFRKNCFANSPTIFDISAHLLSINNPDWTKQVLLRNETLGQCNLLRNLGRVKTQPLWVGWQLAGVCWFQMSLMRDYAICHDTESDLTKIKNAGVWLTTWFYLWGVFQFRERGWKIFLSVFVIWSKLKVRGKEGRGKEGLKVLDSKSVRAIDRYGLRDVCAEWINLI